MAEMVYLKDRMRHSEMAGDIIANVLLTPYLIWLTWNMIAYYRGLWTIGYVETLCACVLIASLRVAILGTGRGCWREASDFDSVTAQIRAAAKAINN